MSDHLPECPVYGHTLIDPGGMSWLPERKKSRIREANARACICPELRACEQRVREEDQRSLIKYGVQMFMRGKQYGRPMAYAAGVQAARDAVLALPVIDRYDKWWSIDGPQAVAVIDALKEKP